MKTNITVCIGLLFWLICAHAERSICWCLLNKAVRIQNRKQGQIRMQSIYQDRLLTLARHVREQASSPLEAPTHIAEVNNPVCGDRIRAAIIIENDVIVATHVEAKGCALCEAGGGLWLKSVLRQTMSSLPEFYATLTSWLAGQEDQNNGVIFSDGLHSFQPVRAIKNRHKCVTLAFSTADKFKRVWKLALRWADLEPILKHGKLINCD